MTEKTGKKPKMLYVDPEKWGKWDKFLKAKYGKSMSRSKRIDEIIDQDLGSDQKPTDDDDFFYKAKKEEENKLSTENKSLLRQIGGNDSKAWKALCRLTQSFGLRVIDGDDFDGVMRKLARYKFNDREWFTESDLRLFEQKLIVMRKMAAVHKEIIKWLKRHPGYFIEHRKEQQKHYVASNDVSEETEGDIIDEDATETEDSEDDEENEITERVTERDYNDKEED